MDINLNTLQGVPAHRVIVHIFSARHVIIGSGHLGEAQASLHKGTHGGMVRLIIGIARAVYEFASLVLYVVLWKRRISTNGPWGFSMLENQPFDSLNITLLNLEG